MQRQFNAASSAFSSCAAEADRPDRGPGRPRFLVRIGRRGNVICQAVLKLDLPASAAWGQLRDFSRFSRRDFFHTELEIEGGTPRPGAALVLTHRFLGIQTSRVGRILLWREGVGYAFSDLSRRGVREGFPHVFAYRLEPDGDGGCRLHIVVRGRWTTPFLPRWAARIWLLWVFSALVTGVRNDFLAFRAHRQTRARDR